ncbi:MAG: hypothetical protein AABN33_02290 [Acidobacteriota bacterium]
MAEIENSGTGMEPGSPVIVYLHSPREKTWGVLLELNAAGVFVRGIDLNTFDDWVQMIVRGERNMGLTHVFFPMWRVERVVLDESVDEIPSLGAQFYARVGLTFNEYLDSD